MASVARACGERFSCAGDRVWHAQHGARDERERERAEHEGSERGWNGCSRDDGKRERRERTDRGSTEHCLPRLRTEHGIAEREGHERERGFIRREHQREHAFDFD
jgi:hypothetical protein